jgi:hypothetical protein
VASTGLHGLLTGSRTPAVVLGRSGHAIWLHTGESVVVITVGDGARLPNGIHIPAETGAEVLRRVRDDTTALIGNGRVVLDDVAVTIGRWWDAHPRLPSVTIDDLAARLEGLPAEIPDFDGSSLSHSLRVRSAGGVLHAARSLLGKGPGLTPEGDDLLTGAVAATRLLGEALGREATVAWIAGISLPLAKLAEERTTTFSAAMLGLALRGQVVEPAAVLLRALAGRGDVAAGHLGLIRLGHTSGPAIAAGIVLAAQSLIE